VTDQLLHYYNRELANLRRLGGEFAEAHPKIAGRLRVSTDTVEDPHVSRLIESVAFLNARIRHKLDDDFPELTEALLSILYPHFLAPIPSMAIVQLECDRELTGSYGVPAGTMIETDRVHGDPCRFRSVYPVETWPIEIESAEILGAPFEAPATPNSKTCAAVLHMVLRTQVQKVTFAELGVESLRFHLRGDATQSFDLYELLANDVLEVVVATKPNDPEARILPGSCIRPVGFEHDEGLLPYPDRSFIGYRLLTEYFAFPRKFLFLDVEGLDSEHEIGNELHLFFYLRRSSDDLEHSVEADSFALGCTPVVNLFEKRAEPIQVDQTEESYHVVADARYPLSTEVYSIDDVILTRPDSKPRELKPLFGLHPAGRKERSQAYWTSARRPTMGGDGQSSGGTEMTISIVDPDMRVDPSVEGVLATKTTCFNRNLPNRLPFGGDQPHLRFSEGGGPIQRIRCISPPTKVLRPGEGESYLWKLISHLSLNHLSIGQGEGATKALREILTLYDASGSPENGNVIAGIEAVESRPTVMRILSGGHPGVCRGVEIAIHFDEARYTGSGLFLFASVLERFIGLYSSMNSFVQLVATSTTREGEIKRWAPRSGEKTLI